MAVRMKRKGMFFTFLGVILVIAMLMVFQPKTDLEYDSYNEPLKTRVMKINNFMDDLEEIYLKRVLESSTYKTLLSMVYYMDKKNEFLENQSYFQEVLFFGTINGNSIDVINGKEIMINNTLKFWTDNLEEAAFDLLKIDINFSMNSLILNQSEPWMIDSYLNISYDVISEKATWKRNRIIYSKIPIEDIYDPLYYVNSNGNYKKLPVKARTKFYEWNATEFRNFISNETYFHWHNSKSPSFIMRFTNDSSASPCCGIESVVNPKKTQIGRIQSSMGYNFWNSSEDGDCSLLYNVTYPEILSEFPGVKLTFDEIVRYNITSYKKSC